MIRINLPDGRFVNIDTEDRDVAIEAARKYLKENPSIERGAQLGEEDISPFGDIGRGRQAGVVSAAEGITTLPMELLGSEEEDIQNIHL